MERLMKRILSLAIAAAAIGLFAFASNASASDQFHGRHYSGYGGHGLTGHQYATSGYSAYGQGGYSSAYRGNCSAYGGYRRGPVQSYAPNYGYGGGSYGVAPGYRSGYAPSNNSTRGGIHLDIGRFHVLGLGGHH